MTTCIYAIQLVLHMLGSLGDVGAGLVLLFALYKHVRALALQLRPSMRSPLEYRAGRGGDTVGREGTHEGCPYGLGALRAGDHGIVAA
jgi:hypothetical protein